MKNLSKHFLKHNDKVSAISLTVLLMSRGPKLSYYHRLVSLNDDRPVDLDTGGYGP